MPAIRYFKISFVQVYNFFVVLNSYLKSINRFLADNGEINFITVYGEDYYDAPRSGEYDSLMISCPCNGYGTVW